MLKELIHGGRPGLYLFTGCFVAGISLTLYAPRLPPWWCAAALVPALMLARRFAGASLLVVLLCGIIWATWRGDLLLQRAIDENLVGRDLFVTGRVASLLQQDGQSLRFDFDVRRLYDATGDYPSPGRVRLRIYRQDLRVEPGARWQFAVRLRHPRSFRNPGSFDYERYLYRHGIRAVGYVRRSDANREISAAPRHSVLTYRHRIARTLQQLESDSPAKSLVSALAVGDRSQLTAQQWQIMTRTGTNHLMAISGLHIGLMAGIGFFLGSTLWRHGGRAVLFQPAPRAGALCAMAAAICYALLAGFSTPTQRAVIMLLCMLGATSIGRPMPMGRGLAVAMWVVLGLDPLNVLDPGFWLSFAAVAWILFAIASGPKANRWQRSWRVQLALGLALGPLTLGWFGHWPLISPVANLLAVPLVGMLVVPVILVAVLAIGLGWVTLAAPLLEGACWLLDQLWRLLSALARWPELSWQPPAEPSLWVLAAASLGVCWLLLPLAKRWRLLGLVWLAPLLTLAPQRPPHGAVEVSVLDVGQGLSIVVQTQGHTLLFDAGASYGDRFDLGRVVVVPYLRARGISRLDTMVISHGDNDHIGGADSVRASVPVTRILSSVPDRLASAASCLRGQHWHWDGVDFAILHPDTPDVPPHNNASCVLRIEAAAGSMLLTGDIEAETENKLVREQADRLRADVLLIPHQGSRTSSTPGFIDAVQPVLAVVSAGYRNRYGHPAADVVARYTERGIPILNTAHLGAVRVDLGTAGIRWRGWYPERRRYWSHDP